MLKPAASLARKIVRDMHIYTRGRPMHWVPMDTVMRRLSPEGRRGDRGRVQSCDVARLAGIQGASGRLPDRRRPPPHESL